MLFLQGRSHLQTQLQFPLIHWWLWNSELFLFSASELQIYIFKWLLLSVLRCTSKVNMQMQRLVWNHTHTSLDLSTATTETHLCSRAARLKGWPDHPSASASQRLRCPQWHPPPGSCHSVDDSSCIFPKPSTSPWFHCCLLRPGYQHFSPNWPPKASSGPFQAILYS